MRRGSHFKLAALGLALVSALTGIVLVYRIKTPTVEDKGVLAHLFRDWGKPDLVLVLSAQQHGYMLPCGCSSPQLGGLERRYNFMELLKAKGRPVVAVDLGDVPQKHGPAKLPNVQGLLKYRYSLTALKKMGYLAVGVGEYELALPPIADDEGVPFPQPTILSANVSSAIGPRLSAIGHRVWPIADSRKPIAEIKIGVTSVVGPGVAERIKSKDPTVEIIPWADSLREQWKKLQADKVDLPLLLFHGLATGSKEAEAIQCAKAFPEFPVILCLSAEDDPPDHPESVEHPQQGTRTDIFRLGNKGKHLGVLGVYRNGSAFSFKYQLVTMGEEYKTPPEQEANQPILQLMEDYTRELKSKNYLKEYVPSLHPLQKLDVVPGLNNPGDGEPQYIGSEACGKCHDHAFDVWQASKHSHAYQTLVDAEHPSLRQYDGECIVCHTIGFGYQSGFRNEKDTPKLVNVGCESCHGPGSLHKQNPNDKEWQKRMNWPWSEGRAKVDVKAKNRAIEKFCVTCHDSDNDVTWFHDTHDKKDPFVEKWEKRKIVHDRRRE